MSIVERNVYRSEIDRLRALVATQEEEIEALGGGADVVRAEIVKLTLKIEALDEAVLALIRHNDQHPPSSPRRLPTHIIDPLREAIAYDSVKQLKVLKAMPSRATSR